MIKLAMYLLFGALCATVTAAFEPEWHVTLIAFWLGTCLGLFVGLMAAVFDRLTKALQ